MAARQAAGGLARVVHVTGRSDRACRCACGWPLRRTIILFGSSCRHCERALGAVDLDEQVVLAAVADLRGGDGAQRAVLEADHGVAVVVELAALFEDLQVAADRFGQQARSCSGPGCRRACRCRRSSRPRRSCFGSVRQAACFWSFAFQPRAQPALHVVDADGVDLAQLARQDHLAGPAAPADSRCSCA